MNPNNPLVNRLLYETKSSKRKRRINHSKDEIAEKDKILIPKFTKNVMELNQNTVQNKQKALLIKPNIHRLPPLGQKFSQRQIGFITSTQQALASTKKPMFRDRKVSWNQTSQISMFPTQLLLTPRQEQKNNQVINGSQKLDKQVIKKIRTVSYESPNQKTEEELFQYLKILENNNELKNQFCYMNRGELPYSYFIVNYKQINKKQFLTVSLRGISIYKDDESQFTTIKKLKNEVDNFRKIKKIQFFLQYSTMKIFKHWKFTTIRKKFENQCKIISKISVSQNVILQKYLHFLFNQMEDFIKCKFLDIRVSTTLSLQKIKQQLKNKQKTLQKSLEFFQNQIQKNLKNAIQKNYNQFKDNQKINVNKNHGKQINQQLYLPYDTMKRPMKYTQIAKLKQFQASIYRLLKMTDLVRLSTKIFMVIGGLQNFAQQLNTMHQRYLNRKQISFVSWISTKLSIIKPQIQGESSVFECNPPLIQIQQALQTHLQGILQNFYKKHYLLIQKKNEYCCQSVQVSSNEVASKQDFRIHMQQNYSRVQLKNTCKNQLNICIEDVKQYLQGRGQILLKIHQDCFLEKQVSYYMNNQQLNIYLTAVQNNREILNNFQPYVQFGLVYLDLGQLLYQIKQKFQQKFKSVSNNIPAQVIKRCEMLVQKIRMNYDMFKQNPVTIHEFIIFNNNYNTNKLNIIQLQKKIQQILQLQQIVYEKGLKVGQGTKSQINQCLTYYRQLQKRLEQIQSNEQKDKKKFTKMTDDLVDPLNDKSQQLYKKIYQDNIVGNYQQNINIIKQKLEIYDIQYKKIRQKKQQLFSYQKQLKLGNKDLPNYFKLQNNLQQINKIWKGRYKYLQFLSHINNKGYSQKLQLSISQLKHFIKYLQSLQLQIQFVQLLQHFKADALKVLNIIQICKMLSADTLQQQHKKIIKNRLITKNKKIKDYIFTIQGGRTILCNQLITQTNIIQIKQLIQQTVHDSAQQSNIKRYIIQVQQFWKKSKIIIVGNDLAKNGTQIMHFGLLQNQKLQQKIGSYEMQFKNIISSKYAIGQLHNRVLKQIKMCEYMKKLIQKWVQVQREWIKLLPLMTNCPSVKHQSNVYFQFTSVDNHLRKYNRQVHDLISIKKIVDDYQDSRYLVLMENCQKQLIAINKTFNNFLNMKRNTYYRFFFIADQQLITILENTKDAKTLTKYANYCFNCNKITLEKQLISGFETSSQVFKLRRGYLKGQPDQMFKLVEENMKMSLKSAILSLIPKMKIGMNIQQEHENPLQVVLVADKLLWTEMTEDYLNPTSYQSYQLFIRRHCDELLKYLKKTDLSSQQRHKISIRLTQAMGLRQIGEEMMKLQITKQDFKWKQQLKFVVQEQEIAIIQFNRKFLYGLQYYPPSKITIPTNSFRMLLNKVYETTLFSKVLILKGTEGDGKRNMMRASAQQFGCYHKELVCNKNLSYQYLLRFIQGSILAGAWLSLYQFQHLQSQVLAKLFNQIRKVAIQFQKNQIHSVDNNLSQSQKGTQIQVQGSVLRIPIQNITLKQQNEGQNQQNTEKKPQKSVIYTQNRAMFSFITHQSQPQRVSVYKFDSFTLSEPSHKKICQWLFQVNNFIDWQHLSVRLISFLQTVSPFLQRVMGSFMSILRKVIDSAAQKKKIYSYKHKQVQMVAQAFKQQILDKSDENIHSILYQALHNYFLIDIPQQHKSQSQKLLKKRSLMPLIRKQSLSFDTKLSVLCLLINKQIQNILVIGPRTNKSKIIKQAIKFVNKQILTIYPQSIDYFFYDQTIQKLNKINQGTIIHYDGQSMVRQWNDLVISGYLLMEGKKIYLHNQLIIQLREVNNCSPSFVGSCQLVYIGNSLGKKQRFMQQSQSQNCELITQPMQQIFGDQLQHLPDHYLETFAQFLKQYTKQPKSKNYHKLIVWLGNVLGISGLWNRYYAGKYTDVTVNQLSHQLVLIDQYKYLPIQSEMLDSQCKNLFTMGNLLVHTKSSILFLQLIKNLMQISLPVIFVGKQDSGKSTLLKLLFSNLKILSSNTKKQKHHHHPNHSSVKINTVETESVSEAQDSSQPIKINLNIKVKTVQWTKTLKSQLTNIRKDGKNFLVNVGDNDIFVTVDDLDLGFETHRQYLRQLIDLKTLRDCRFEQFAFEKLKVIVNWLKQSSQSIKSTSKTLMKSTTQKNNKFFDRMTELHINQFTKQILQTIIRTNIQNFTKKNSISKQVMNIIQNNFVRTILIAFDDFVNIKGANAAAVTMISVMHNFISLPKKNVLMSAQNYVKFFKIILKQRLLEKCFTSKNIWLTKNIYQNILKISLNNLFQKNQLASTNILLKKSSTTEIVQTQEPETDTVFIFQQKLYKYQHLSKLKQKISVAFPHLYIFDEMLKLITRLNNQIFSIDRNCILVGRTGTGKQTILQIVAHLNNISICNGNNKLYDCIIKSLRGNDVILEESYLRRNFTKFMHNGVGTQFQRIDQCQNDEDLQNLLIQEEYKKQYSQIVNTIPNRQIPHKETKVLKKVREKLRSVLIFDAVSKYHQALKKYRELNRYYVCFIDEWPAQALLNISGVSITDTKMTELVPQKQKQNQTKHEIDLPKLLAQIFVQTNNMIQNIQQQSISIRRFKNYIKIFEKLYQKRYKDISYKIQFYTKIYNTFHDACILISQWQKRVDVLNYQLQFAINKLDQQLKINRKQTVTFAQLYRKRQQQEKILSLKNDQMSKIQKKMFKQLQGIKKIMEQIQKIVGSMQRTQMSQLKKIYKSNRIAYFGLQCLCLLFCQQLTQKTVNKILADPNLMMKMKSQTTLENKNNKIIQKFKNQFDTIKEEYQIKSKAQASKIIIDWLKSVLEYWNVLTDYQALTSQYNNHKKIYQQSLFREKQMELQIMQLKEKTIKLNQNFEELFKKKQQNLKQCTLINNKLRNAKKVLPALQNSQKQTWQLIKQQKNSESCLIGNLLLCVTCLVYLPLRKLRVKRQVIQQIKRMLNQKMIQFNQDFISSICKTQDSLIQDLNLLAIKQFQQYPILIVDPQRRALPFLFQRDTLIAQSIITKNINDLTNSIDIATEIQRNKIKQSSKINQFVLIGSKQQIKDNIDVAQSCLIQSIKQQKSQKYIRCNPILHTTDQNFRYLLQKLPEDTFLIDWKYTTINPNQKIFSKIAVNKKPEYFIIKKQLNRKIKKDIQKIQMYKNEIYTFISNKQMKILQNDEFIELGTKLMQLQIQTQKNKILQKQKMLQIKQYSRQINQEVTKVILIINTLIKIKKIPLDLILNVACSDGNTIQNIIQFVLAIIEPNQRLGWLFAIAMDFQEENNQQLINLLVKDTPLKINEIARQKKPLNISTKNYENLCKLSCYTPNIRNFTQIALKYPKQFETWTIDNSQSIPQILKPETIKLIQQLTIIKYIKPKIFISVLKQRIKNILKIQNIQGYSNKQVLLRVGNKFPIITHCSMQTLSQLCHQLNNSKIVYKSLVQIQDSLHLKKFIWNQMGQGNWVVLHSVFDRNTRQTLQDIIQYVTNYDQQQNFRIFIYIDQLQLAGFQSYHQISTKYDKINQGKDQSLGEFTTKEQLIVSESKYIENVCMQMYEQPISFQKVLMQSLKNLEVQLPQINLDLIDKNTINSNFSNMHYSQTTKVPSLNKANSAVNPSMVFSNSLGMSGSIIISEKQRFYLQKLLIHNSILQVAMWIKFPKLRMNICKSRSINIIKYIKQYQIPLQFNLYAIATYLGKLHSAELANYQRIDAQELCQRIMDQTKINDKVFFGIPVTKHGIVFALKGIGKAGATISRNWLDQKVRNNDQLLGCEESYTNRRNAFETENILQTLGNIKFFNRSIKDETAEIRTALSRIPTNPLIFNKQIKNVIFLHCYMNEFKAHNRNLMAGKQFLQWVNIASNQQIKADENSSGYVGSTSIDIVDAFTWQNLMKKIQQLTECEARSHKIRMVLNAWIQNLKRKHQMLLYWNVDNPVLVLHPILLANFPMVVSTYIIHYLSTNYERIRVQCQSTNQNILYSLQMQFSRQTDQKQLFMTEGILLPDLLYRQFKYNFEYKMLDGSQQLTGQQLAPLIMLKMKKMPIFSEFQNVIRDKGNQDYQSPSIQIAVRANNKINIVYVIKTYIDGNFQQWGLRRPMLISQ